MISAISFAPAEFVSTMTSNRFRIPLLSSLKSSSSTFLRKLSPSLNDDYEAKQEKIKPSSPNIGDENTSHNISSGPETTGKVSGKSPRVLNYVDEDEGLDQIWIRNRPESNSVNTSMQDRCRAPSVPEDADWEVLRDEEEKMVGWSLFKKGEARAIIGRWNEALSFWITAHSVQLSAFGNAHPILARTIIAMGVALAKLGKTYESLLEFEKAVRIQKDVLGKYHSEVVETLLYIGTVRHQRGNFIGSIESFQEAANVQRINFGENDPSVGNIMCTMGHAYYQRRMYSDAGKAYGQGIVIYRAAGLGRDHPRVRTAMRYLSAKTIVARTVTDFWVDSNAV